MCTVWWTSPSEVSSLIFCRNKCWLVTGGLVDPFLQMKKKNLLLITNDWLKTLKVGYGNRSAAEVLASSVSNWQRKEGSHWGLSSVVKERKEWLNNPHAKDNLKLAQTRGLCFCSPASLQPHLGLLLCRKSDIYFQIVCWERESGERHFYKNW